MVYLHNGILRSREKEGAYTLTTAWMELVSIMLSEISQAGRDKYHMISPLTGTESLEEKSKQNITRDIEVKNNLTIARGGAGAVGRGDYRNYYKGHMDKTKGEGGGFSWGGVEGWGEKAYNCN